MLRKIAPEDRALYLEMTREFYASDAVLRPVPESYLQITFDELMRSDTYLDCRIFETDAGEAAGYALLCRSFSQEAGGPVVWIDELYLRAPYRGQGRASAFFRELQALAPAARYRLEVEPDNARAEALYRRCGFDVLPYRQMVRDLGPMNEV